VAEANHRLPQFTVIAQARITTAAHVLAQIRARQHVKDQLRRQGLKVSHYAARDISCMAQSYLALHQAELMPDCIAQARAMILSGALGKRARAQLVTEYRKVRTLDGAEASSV
jgi:hypothetical protein